MGGQQRPLFKRPAWAKPLANPDEDLFQRSNRSYRSSKNHTIHSEYTAMRNGKNIVEDGSQESDRASTASDEHDFRVESSTDPPAPHILSSHDEGSVKPGRSSPRPRPSPGHVSPLPAHESKSRKRRLPHAEADTIDLEAHSGPSPESSIMVSLDAKAMSTGTDSREEVPTINNGEQEDFPELARLARERARRRRHEEDMSSRPKAVSDVDVTSSAFSYSPDSRTMQSKSSTITMQILVTSTIAGTQPLIVTRTFSQRLKEVRLAWIRHQQLKNDQLDRAFLTYRGRRVFDVVSCKDLGVIAAPSGEDSKSHEACHVHMVVMTREGFDAHRQSRERQHDSGPDSDHEADDKPEPIVQEEAQIRITLQSRHYSDFKLIVKPSTCISKVINAFRTSNGLKTKQEVKLQFDGETLDSSGTIADTELSDLDHLEVYVKDS